jgi:hypothetical protein
VPSSHRKHDLPLKLGPGCQWPPLDRPVVAYFKIVKRYWTVSSARQRLARMATDEACDRLRGSFALYPPSHLILRVAYGIRQSCNVDTEK